MIFDTLALQDELTLQYRFFYRNDANVYDDLRGFVQTTAEPHEEEYRVRLVRYSSLDTCCDPISGKYFMSIWNCECEDYSTAFSYLWDNYSKLF